MKAIVLESAQKALDRKTDLSGETWLTVEDGRAVGMDFPAYARAITRMKTAPAFDGLELETAEKRPVWFGKRQLPPFYKIQFGTQ